MRFWGKRFWLVSLLLLIAVYFVRPAYIYATSGPTEEQSKCLREGKPGDPKILVRDGTSGVVKTVKMTDLGEFADRCEVTDALYELNWEREVKSQSDFNVAVKPNTKETARPKFVVLYIHGWHHGADPNAGDLLEFQKLITNLASVYPDQQVTGLYVSWNANSDLPLWHYLDFWQKAAVADRIAASGNVTSFISAASEIIAKSKPGGRFITIGHSFGARILMSSSAQSALVSTQKAHPGQPGGTYKQIESLSQTAILLNPALEAAYFTPLASFSRPAEKFSPQQKPIILTISTENDWATGYAFPLGQWLAWKTAEKEVRTLGNYKDFQTHTLTSESKTSCENTGQVTALTEGFQKDDICLRRTNSFKHNPFMVVRTNAEILSGHNGIWDRRFSEWLFSYVEELGKQLPPKEKSE
ncbi:hypothetical protein [Methylobacterium thuringiense]|uniref:Alpha/beta hydrolase n=1 Tax=Methylobacterium thuringiense TaxID=1003091 RepID=A0ABQ4TFK0_9HYPH|nr:hypothetical protein [Methylobacterium thuringiense]GJE53801.1 hypothetical protein EKPJFOCH_0269 [Methylobacterium thuringiense]